MDESKEDLTEPGDDDIARHLRLCLGRAPRQVRSDQVEEARKVIAAFERGDFAIDEAPDAE
jgi:hypothetical protein